MKKTANHFFVCIQHILELFFLRYPITAIYITSQKLDDNSQISYHYIALVTALTNWFFYHLFAYKLITGNKVKLLSAIELA